MHDFISLQIEVKTTLNPEICTLYLKGHSINEISRQFGLSYSSVRAKLVTSGVQLRPKNSVRFEPRSKKSFKSSSPPPYGYCYIDGKLHKDPKEYSTLQIIQKQLVLGRSQTEIAHFLTSKKLKTRFGKIWRQNHIHNIIKRLNLVGGN